MNATIRYQFNCWAIATVVTAIALILTLLLKSLLAPALGSFFIIAIAIGTWYGGIKLGLLVTGLSTLAINYFFIPPLHALTLARFSDVVRLGAFVLVALIINFLNCGLPRSKQQVEQLRQQLQDRERQLQLILTAARVGTWDVNILSAEVKWSAEHEELFGLAPGSFDGKLETFFTCVHPEDREALNRAVDWVIQTGELYQHDYRIIQPNGSIRWMESRGQVFCDRTGQAVRMAGTVIDITRHKQAEAALQRSERRLRAIFDTEPECLKIVTTDGILLDINTAGLVMTEADSLEQLLGRRIWEPVVPEHQQALINLLQQVIEEKSAILEFEIEGLKGTRRWLESHAVALLEGDEAVTKILVVTRDITERKRIEQALRHSEEKFRQLAETVEEVFWMSNAEFNQVLYVSPAYEQMWGRSCQSLYADFNSFIEAVHPADLPKIIAVLNQKVKTFELEYRIIHPDGSMRWILCRSFPVYSESGEIYRRVGIVRDITERKQAEIELRESEQRYASLAEASPVGIFRTDAQSNCLYVNDRLCQITGLSHESVKRKGWIKGLHPADRKRVVTSWEYATQNNLPFHMEYRFQHSNGDVTWIFCQAVVERAANGELVGYVGTITDISDRVVAELALKQVNEKLELRVAKRTAELTRINQQLKNEIIERQQIEATLRESERRWRSLLEDVQLVVVGLDRRGNVEYVNPFFLEVTGYTQAEVLGKNWFENFLPLSQQQNINTVFWEFVEQNFHRYYQNPLVTKSGEERCIAWNNSILQDAGGKVVGTLSIGEDISHRQAVERIKNEFISVVSHELRTPLTSIRGSLGLLATGIYDNHPQKARRMIEIAATDSDRLVRLINDILDLERLESGRIALAKQVCDAAELMQQAAQTVQAIALEAEVTIDVSPLSVPVWADPDPIIQTFINLLGNAIEFSPRGSTIWLTVQATNRNVLFAVKDRGRGIPTDKLEAIFERFYQVDASDSRKKGGTGLGLAICRSIVEQHGGRIWAESILDRGSTFCFTLPMPAELQVSSS